MIHVETEGRKDLRMSFLEIFDETLDINSTANYQLSVQISSDNLVYCIFDTIRSKFILLRSYDSGDNKYFTGESISDTIIKDDFLTRKFGKVNLIFSNPKSTLVPAPFFDPAKKETYFSLNHIIEENQTILFNRVTEPDSYIVFAVSEKILETLFNFFPGITPMHHTKPLLQQLHAESRHTQGFYVHIYIGSEFFNLFIFEDANLKFSNSFSFRNISDILYYVLNTYKKMNISNMTAVHFSGCTEKFDDIYSAFAIYLKNIRFSTPSGNFSFSYVFNDVELHRFTNLFTAINCVS